MPSCCIPEGSAAPRAEARTFTTVSDGQRAVEIRIVRCGGGRVRPEPIVRFLLAGIRAGRRGEARIEIGLALEEGLMLRAWAAETGGSAREEIFFSGAPAVYPRGVGTDLLALLERGVRKDGPRYRSARMQAIEAEAEKIAQGEWGSGFDRALALQTLAGEMANLERISPVVPARLVTPRDAAVPPIRSNPPGADGRVGAAAEMPPGAAAEAKNVR